MVSVMGHVKKCQLNLRDINKSCVLIITAEEKRLPSLYSLGAVIQWRSLTVYPATIYRSSR